MSDELPTKQDVGSPPQMKNVDEIELVPGSS